MNLLSIRGRQALASVGATFFDEMESDGYALIGSKGGSAVAEKKGGSVKVEGSAACQQDGFSTPQELPTSAFPGQTAEESNKAWPSGHQPANLEVWPQDWNGAQYPGQQAARKRLKSCWEVHVLSDLEDGWPGHCSGLQAPTFAQNIMPISKAVGGATDVPTPAPHTRQPTVAHDKLAGCVDKWRLRIDHLARSNLGGNGPDFGDATLVYQDVFPDSGSTINLVVEAQTSYTAEDLTSNGLGTGGHVGFIDVAAKTSVDLKFQFVSAASEKPIDVGPFYVTFFGLNDAFAEIATQGFIEYRRDADSKVTATNGPHGFTEFRAQGEGDPGSIDPEKLTSEQNARAVSVLYPEGKEFTVRIRRTDVEADEITSSPGLLFAGATPFSCPPTLMEASSLRRLQEPDITTPDGCGELCEQDSTCSVWSFSKADGCLQGNGRHCFAGGADGPEVAAARRLQHGRVRVLKDITKLEIMGLYKLGGFSEGDHEEGVRRCKEWCYSVVSCQFWQYGSGGCYVEDHDLQEKPVQYPLTLNGGASANSSLARTLSAGEYIQHYCPPEPLNVHGIKVIHKTEMKIGTTTTAPMSLIAPSSIAAPPESPSWWLGETVADDWPRLSMESSEAAWSHGAQPPPLSAWPKDKKGEVRPCSLVYILADTKQGWPGKCDLPETNLDAKTEEDCRLSCIFWSSCSAWQFTEDGTCYQGIGDKCYSGSGHDSSFKVKAAQRLQHGEVRVVKDITGLEIFNLYNLGVFSEGDAEDGIKRCKRWCYSNIDCQYWQYGHKGCWVDAQEWMKKPVEFPLTLQGNSGDRGGATYSSEFARELEAGEYIQHYCPIPAILGNYTGDWTQFNVSIGEKKGKGISNTQLRIEDTLSKEYVAEMKAQKVHQQQEKDAEKVFNCFNSNPKTWKKDQADWCCEKLLKGCSVAKAQTANVTSDSVTIDVTSEANAEAKDIVALAQKKLTEAEAQIAKSKKQAETEAEKLIASERSKAAAEILAAKKKAEEEIAAQEKNAVSDCSQAAPDAQRLKEAEAELKTNHSEVEKMRVAAQQLMEKALAQHQSTAQDKMKVERMAERAEKLLADARKEQVDFEKSQADDAITRVKLQDNGAVAAAVKKAVEHQKGLDEEKLRLEKEAHEEREATAVAEAQAKEEEKAAEHLLSAIKKIKAENAQKNEELPATTTMSPQDFQIERIRNAMIVATNSTNEDVEEEVARLRELLTVLEALVTKYEDRPYEDKEKVAELSKKIQELKDRTRGDEHELQTQDFNHAVAKTAEVGVLVLIVLLLAAVAYLALWFYRYRRRKTQPSTRNVALDVFRLNATKDRYDYYEAMEGEGGSTIGEEESQTYDVEQASVPEPQPAAQSGGNAVIIVLEKANLELAHSYPDESSAVHAGENELLVVHESLMACLDSPLNKAGMLKLYIHSKEEIVVQVHPACRVPRIFREFAKMMFELLRRGEVHGAHGAPLMEVIQGPVENLLPAKSHRFALTPTGKACALRDLAEATLQLPQNLTRSAVAPAKSSKQKSQSSSNVPSAQDSEDHLCVVFAIGAGNGDAPVELGFGQRYCRQSVSVCPWGLRATVVCHMVCHEFENVWGVYAPVVTREIIQEVQAEQVVSDRPQGN